MLGDTYSTDKWVTTSCIDCGSTFSHPQPKGTNWYHAHKQLFSDVNMTVWQDSTLKHFYIILHTLPKEKTFLSCQQAFMRLPSASEMKEITEWANSTPVQA
jgi:hypothetical protein